MLSVLILLKTHKTSWSSHIRQKKNEENSKNWPNFHKIWNWDIEANLGILIALIILKKDINKMVHFLAFICFLYVSCKHVDWFLYEGNTGIQWVKIVQVSLWTAVCYLQWWNLVKFYPLDSTHFIFFCWFPLWFVRKVI